MTTFKKKGFTLLELIVTLIILSLLALIAIPTFRSLTSKAEVEASAVSLASQGRAVAASTALTKARTYTESIITDELSSFKVGTAPVVVSFTDPSSAEEEINAWISSDGKNFALAQKVKSSCVFAYSENFNINKKIVEDSSATSCLASGLGVEEPSETEAPEVLGTPLLSPPSVNELQASISWAPVAGAQNYEIDPSSGWVINSTTATKTAYAPGVENVRVRAVKDGSYSSWSDSVEINFTSPSSLMVATYDFTAASCPDSSLTITNLGTISAGSTIDWGDGSAPQPLNSTQTHSYSNAGAYDVTIDGKFTQYRVNSSDRNCITKVKRWDDATGTTDLVQAFASAVNLEEFKEIPSSAQYLQLTLAGASKINDPSISTWDTSNVINMGSLFSQAVAFNQPLNNWDVSKVTTLASTFYLAREFNQPLNNWDTSNVTTLNQTFYGALKFNQDINSWDVSKVTDMSATFRTATVFNQPLNSWDTSKVTLLNNTFNGAKSFNQPLNSWNVSQVGSMTGTFQGAASFNQDLNNWNTGIVNNMMNMFNNASSYSKDISNWGVSAVTVSTSFGTGSLLTAQTSPFGV